MKTNLQTTVWLSSAGCFILLTLSGVLWLSTPRSVPAELPTLTTSNLSARPNPTTKPAAIVNSPHTVVKSTAAVINSQPASLIRPLPLVAFSPGSIGEACELNDFPPYHWYDDLDIETRRSHENSPFDSAGDLKVFKERKCMAALETTMNPTNPYLWGKENDTHGKHAGLALVAIDNPLTFERIFADPFGDLARIQEALARPECHFSDDFQNTSKQNETCHADAFLNYALFARHCFVGLGVANLTDKYYTEKDNLTPEQDRSIWIESLEFLWAFDKCRPNGKFPEPDPHELYQQIQALQNIDDNNHWPKKSLYGTLIDLAAHLGDAAARLTYPINHGMFTSSYDEEGFKYGPFAEWFTADLNDPTNLFSKQAPSIDRLRHLVPLFGKNIQVKGEVINFNHQALVQHLCTPPYYIPPSDDDTPPPEPPTCRSIIDDLRQELHDNKTFLSYIATFEDVAMRLDVYE